MPFGGASDRDAVRATTRKPLKVQVQRQTSSPSRYRIRGTMMALVCSGCIMWFGRSYACAARCLPTKCIIVAALSFMRICIDCYDCTRRWQIAKSNSLRLCSFKPSRVQLFRMRTYISVEWSLYFISLFYVCVILITRNLENNPSFPSIFIVNHLKLWKYTYLFLFIQIISTLLIFRAVSGVVQSNKFVPKKNIFDCCLW